MEQSVEVRVRLTHEIAVISVKSYGHRVYGFSWIGHPKALVAISGMFERLPIMGLIPWRLEKVGFDRLRDIGLYRRVA